MAMAIRLTVTVMATRLIRTAMPTRHTLTATPTQRIAMATMAVTILVFMHVEPPDKSRSIGPAGTESRDAGQVSRGSLGEGVPPTPAGLKPLNVTRMQSCAWVKSGNAHSEPMKSAFHPIATEQRT